MSQGKYQVRQKADKMSHKFEVYNALDNELICAFQTEALAQKYADKLNGKEGV